MVLAAITDNVGLQWGAFALCLGLMSMGGLLVTRMFRAQDRRIDRLEAALQQRDAVIERKDAEIRELTGQLVELHEKSMALWRAAIQVFRNRPCLAKSTLAEEGPEG